MRHAPLLLTSLLFLSACADLGECDFPASLELVYTPDGLPAFAGQALINENCGGGGFCHAEGIEEASRVGAPSGLDFDLRLASTGAEPNQEAVDRLDRHQLNVFHNRYAILGQVESGAMPPNGPASTILESVSFGYERVLDDGVTFEALPAIDSSQGRDILRNWLACGSPVIERTEPRLGGPSPIGLTIARCQRACVDPTWPSIVGQILNPGCATSACHDPEEPSAELDLSADANPATLRALLERLEATTAGGPQCRDSELASVPMVTPGAPEQSLLYVKLDPATSSCGARMPLAGAPLSPQRLCAIREWIACGACADPGEEACAACLNNARVACGVLIEADGPTCADVVPCPRFPPEAG